MFLIKQKRVGISLLFVIHSCALYKKRAYGFSVGLNKRCPCISEIRIARWYQMIQGNLGN